MEENSEKPENQNKQDKQASRGKAINSISNAARTFWNILISVIFLLIIGVGISMYLTSRKAETDRQAKIESERISAEKLAKEQALKEKQEAIAKIQKESWDKAITVRDDAMKNPAMLSSAITKFNELKSSLQGTDYAEKADIELAALEAAKEKAINQILADLAEKAEEPANNKDFEAAANIFRSYSGPFSQETREERIKLAETLLVSAKDLTDARRQFQDARNEFLRGASSLIMKNRTADALASCNDFKSKYPTEKMDDIDAVKSIIETIQSSDKYILESCRNDIGGKIAVKTDGPYEMAEISRIKDEAVYVKKSVGAATMETKIKLENLSPEEKIKRSEKMDKASRAVFAALIEKDLGNYDNAERALEPGGILSEHLSGVIKEIKREIESKKVPEAAKTNTKEDSTPKEFVIAPQHITIKADANTKNTGTGDTYMMQDIILKVSISNTVPFDFSGNKIEIYVIGENAADRHVCQILEVEKRDLSLKKKESLDLEVKANSEFNKVTMNKYGAEYCGYLIVIKDKAGKIFTVKTNKAQLQKIVDKIMKMNKSNEFDERTGDEAKGIPAPKRR